MKNRALNCNATNCAHNFNRECRSGAINVSGRSTETYNHKFKGRLYKGLPPMIFAYLDKFRKKK
ncbi:DUF1540 domain-containing protein [Terrisporobacter mayombei]|nr:DUF1540 domain-containing protein [Terrisporobacter mayombei]